MWMFKLIENGEVYAPEHLGRRSVLLANDKIARSQKFKVQSYLVGL
jgi:hypothetical protein